jgi:hypothetical protein
VRSGAALKKLRPGGVELAHRRRRERDVRPDRSEPHVGVHRQPHRRGLKYDGVAPPGLAGPHCGPGDRAADAASSGVWESADVVDTRSVSTADCDRGGNRPFIEPSDEQLDVRVGQGNLP